MKSCHYPIQRRSRLSIDNFFSFFGKDVYLSGNDGLQVIVKGWIPKRCGDIGCSPGTPIAFDCSSFDDACFMFISLVRELIAYVESSK